MMMFAHVGNYKFLPLILSAVSVFYLARDSRIGSLTPKSFLASLNPTRWGRSSQSVSERPLVARVIARCIIHYFELFSYPFVMALAPLN